MRPDSITDCEGLWVQVQQLRQQVQQLVEENSTLRNQRDSLESQVMDFAVQEVWWENVIFMEIDDGEAA